jgi:predicted N-acetyltransferase YhbS
MFSSKVVEPFRRVLDNGLTLKSVATADDAERLIAFNGQMFGQQVAVMTRALLFHHPASRPDYWLFIEDQSQIVSSLVLIPWEWRYDEVTLKCGEMGIVSTRESYRNRGLVRALDTRFKEILRADGFHLSHIQGIPYFYRQFGYEYALPLEMQWRIELRHITAPADPGITFRPATAADIPTLMGFYDATARQLNITAVRNAEIWRYLLDHTVDTATETETWLLEADRRPIGYCRVPREGFGEGLIVSETSRLDQRTAITLLDWLKTTSVERGKPYVRFNLPVTNDLLRVAKGYDAYDAGGYQWQIHVVDAARLLRQLTPVLERRLSASPFADLTQQVVISLYRTGLELQFDHGRLRSVNALPGPDHCDINIPPTLLAPLLLGYRSRAELSAFYPDLRVWGQSAILIDILFPKAQAFIGTQY